MRLLKASIIVMGVLIVFGLVGLIYGVMTMGDGEPARKEELGTRPSASAVDTVRLGLPDGAEIRRIVPNGETVILHLSIPGEGEWLYVVPVLRGGTIVKIALGGAK